MSSRETELYKDRIEVSLDGRQIFYLFFGGAVIVGLVFILGVMIGRRVEARGHVEKARTHAATDPLAALDRLEATSPTSFQNTLSGAPDKPDELERAIAERVKKAGDKGIDKQSDKGDKQSDKSDKSEHAADKSDAKPSDKAADKPADKTADKPADKTADKSDKATDKPADKTADKSDKATDKPVEKPTLDAKASDAKAGDAKAGDKLAAKPDAAKKSEQKFTLQLSSFQDKAEAETFLSTIKSAGYQAYVTEASVSGKGTFYRVRLGKYASLEAANDAKADFETKSKKSASVMKL
jgi:cell division septation protein DedD